jgi:uncharacterized delta-60 repeat protein/uncharacterized repeat protein (TIGR01451 family)
MGARLAGLTAAALLVVPTSALAAPAAPDPGFGSGGVVLTDVAGERAERAGMILDSSGRPVVLAKTGATQLGFIRRLPDGTAEVAENRSVGGLDSELTEVVQQVDGGYVAGGWVKETPGNHRFAVVRYTPAGAPDPVFGVRLASPGEIGGLAVQPNDGRIVAAGRSGSGIGVVRYSAGGAVELTNILDIPGVTAERADGVVVEPGGRILLAGTAVEGGERRFLVAALTPAGALDPSFGGGRGFVTLDVGDGDAAVRSMERQPDGKLLVAGTTDGGGGGGGGVARFLPDGTSDIGFSTDGIARLGVPAAIVEDVAVQSDGKVVAVGSIESGTATGDSFVARFRPGGARDPGFGTDGVARRSLDAAGDGLTGVGLAAGGAIVAGGIARGAGPSIVLTRLTGGDSSDPALAMTAGSLGDLVTFTITATNPGADPAQDVKVMVAPPGDVAATALATAGNVCSGTTCSLGTLAPGITRRMTLLARSRAPGPLTAAAQVATATFDSDTGNNHAGATGVASRNRVVRRDRAKPKLALRLPARRIRQVRRRVKLVVRTNEAASVVVRTRWTAKGRTRTFAKTRTVTLRRKGAKTVRLALTRAGRQAVKRKKTRRLALSVKARARDKAGNKRTRTLRKTLRRKPRRR